MTYVSRTYWQPAYAFIRRTVLNPEDARDLTQSFFADLLGDRSLARADPEKGRFRSFLLGAAEHFITDQHDKIKERKRGGHVEIVAFEPRLQESRYGAAPAFAVTADALFDRGWALALTVP